MEKRDYNEGDTPAGLDGIVSGTGSELVGILGLNRAYNEIKIRRMIQSRIESIENGTGGVSRFQELNDILEATRNDENNLSEYYDKLQEYKMKAYCNEVEIYAGLINNGSLVVDKKGNRGGITNFNSMIYYIEEAKKLGADLTDLESQLDELEIKAYKNDVEHYMSNLYKRFKNKQKFHSGDYELMEYAMSKLIDLDEDVSSYKEKIATIFIERAEYYAGIIERGEQDFENSGELGYTDNLFYFVSFVREAKKYGADVSNLESKSNEIRKKDIEDRINYCFSMLEKGYNDLTYQALQNYLKAAESLGININEYLDKLNTISN